MKKPYSMQIPKLKIALIAGQSRLRLRAHTPLHIKPSRGQTKSVPAGELSISCRGSSEVRRPARAGWLWVSKSPSMEDAAIKAGKVSQDGLTVSIHPVGLTPLEDKLIPRDYRLLVKGDQDPRVREDIRKRIIKILPERSPVVIKLPQDDPTEDIYLKDDEGQEYGITSPIECASESAVELIEAPVGEGFHWQHTETLSLPAPIWIALGSDGKLCGGVEVEMEDYLASVNSSEMPAESPLEFLKAQVVAARSWLLANWGSHHPGEPYVVCGGDHCQCYQGQSRIKESSRQAVEGTRGQVLMYSGRICDARYAKSCGGIMEPAANVWPFVDEPYLGHGRDLPGAETLDLSDESRFREFQQREHKGDACCSPGYSELGAELTELANLYRWREEISGSDLSGIIQSKTRRDVGEVEELRPVRRGPSGRLIEVHVKGSRDKLSLTPELEIRRCLSRTHLPSSAFWIENMDGKKFILNGMGWGHGVGMCQIGAASLAVRGYWYDRILSHYYPKTGIEKIY